MEIFIFARFHAREGHEAQLEATIREVGVPTREEPGCLFVLGFQSIHDPRLFFVHSRWKDEAAFERHSGLPHTVRFLERIRLLIDHPLENVSRTRLIENHPPSPAEH